MTENVKPPTPARPGSGSVRRRYDVTLRQEQARARRRDTLAAAQQLFQDRGYSATTIADVARAAGVSAESVYKSFGGKAALLKEVFDVVMAGDDEPVAVAERAGAQAIRAEPDVRRKLLSYADQATVRANRSAPIQLVIRNGASSDPDLQRLWAQLTDQRLVGMTMLANHLADTGGLRVGPDEARDVLWTCISIEVYDLLVLQRHWSLAAFTDWLGRTLIASLVGD